MDGPAGIRGAQVGDARELALLCAELGYPTRADEVEARLRELLVSPAHLVLVAVDAEDRALAFLHAEERRALHAPAHAQVVALVVAAERRGSGIGAALLSAAESWARGRGLPVVRVRSNVVREGAHRFYARAGYAVAKTSLLFTRTLA